MTCDEHFRPVYRPRELGRLIDRRARLDIKDMIYQGTPLDWTIYLEHDVIASYLRERGAPAG